MSNQYPVEGDLIEDKYRIGKMLGSGGMGAVIGATHVLRQAPVALKFMSPDLINTPGVVERFFNEGVAASRIDNDHVVNVLDVSRLPSGLPYLVMEFLRGEDLAGLIAREGKQGLPDVPRAVHIALQILRGLQAAHDANIIHRDLKPANCFVMQRDGEPDFIKIVDFGISKVRETTQSAQLTMAGSMLGSPLYISPEQARDSASVDNRADLYGVAIILYELLCGHPPFDPASGQLSELFILVATESPKPLSAQRSDLPPGLDEIVLRGLSKSPDDRHQTPVEMAEALSVFADERSDVVIRQLLPRSSMRASSVPAGYKFEATEVLPPTESVGPPSAEPPSALASSVVASPAAPARKFTGLKVAAPFAALVAIVVAVFWATPEPQAEEPLGGPVAAEALPVPSVARSASGAEAIKPVPSPSVAPQVAAVPDIIPADARQAPKGAAVPAAVQPAVAKPVVRQRAPVAPVRRVRPVPKPPRRPARRSTPSLNDIEIEL